MGDVILVQTPEDGSAGSWVEARRPWARVAFVSLISGGTATAGSDGAEIAGCGVCSSILIIPIVLIALNIALLVWVARDAKARGMDSAILWMLLVMFTSVIGLVIYLFSRPQGEVVQCSNCRNRRLQASVRCPHCGVA